MNTQSSTAVHMRIGEAARRLGIHPQTLRRWEREGRVCRARRRLTGQRVYLEEDVQQLEKMVFSRTS